MGGSAKTGESVDVPSDVVGEDVVHVVVLHAAGHVGVHLDVLR